MKKEGERGTNCASKRGRENYGGRMDDMLEGEKDRRADRRKEHEERDWVNGEMRV